MASTKNVAGINLKMRAKNPQFWFQIFLAIAVPIGAYFGITGEDVSSWGVLWDTILEAVSNPYLLFIIAVSLYNSLIDSTTRGFADTEQVLQRNTPIDNKKPNNPSVTYPQKNNRHDKHNYDRHL